MKHSFVKSVCTRDFLSVTAEQRYLKYLRLTNLSDNCQPLNRAESMTAAITLCRMYSGGLWNVLIFADNRCEESLRCQGGNSLFFPFSCAAELRLICISGCAHCKCLTPQHAVIHCYHHISTVLARAIQWHWNLQPSRNDSV